MVRKAYSFKAVRMTIKFSVMFLSIKAGIEYLEYFFAEKVPLRHLPRASYVHDRQHPLNPPIHMPYCFPDNYEELKVAIF